MKHSRIFALLGIVLVVEGIMERGWMLLAVWAGSNCIALGWAMARGKHHLFGKRPDGSIPPWSCVVFFPFLATTYAVWNLTRLVRSEPAYNIVNEQLVVGRRLLPSEWREECDNYLDLTAEFSEPAALGKLPAYVSFPILDASAPSPGSLEELLRRLKPGRTFVHCAQGHGRTGLVAIAILLKSGAASTVEEGLQMLKAKRPAVGINALQRKCAEDYSRAYPQ